MVASQIVFLDTNCSSDIWERSRYSLQIYFEISPSFFYVMKYIRETFPKGNNL
jgi:hypothetical protein